MSRSLMRHDPDFGHRYVPNMKARVAEGGGYLLRTNAAGFRSEHEFTEERNPGTTRVLTFGDSQTAGDGVSNPRRWTDLLQTSMPDVQIDNLAVSGTGTDQQFLTWRTQAHRAHDLVVIGVYVENIRRITSRVMRSRDTADGEDRYSPKPYFTLGDVGLAEHHVPVPRDHWRVEDIPEHLAHHVYPPPVPDAVPTRAKPAGGVSGALAPLHRGAKAMAMRLERYRPLQAYDRPTDPSWLLMCAILTTWIESSTTPVVVVPLPHYFFLTQPLQARGYQQRFAELGDRTGCHVADPLPGLVDLPGDVRRGLWSDSLGHLSEVGHRELARLLKPVVSPLLQPPA